MKIEIHTKSNKEIEDFEDREWASAEIEHYGHAQDWDKKEYFLAARNKENEIVGILRFSIKGGVAHIQVLVVAKSARRQGIGRQLMLKVEEIARASSAHVITLKVEINRPAMKLYKALGYHGTARLPDHYYRHDFAFYSKYLETGAVNQ